MNFAEQLREQARRAQEHKNVEFMVLVAEWVRVAKANCAKAAKQVRTEFMFYTPKVAPIYTQNLSEVAAEVQNQLIAEGLKVELIPGRGAPALKITW